MQNPTIEQKEERKAEEETMLAEIAAKKAVAQDERERLLAQAAAAFT